MRRTETEVRAILRRMLANGPLTALPKRQHDLEVFLALGAARFEPKRAYAEAEVNDLLQAWLEPFCSHFGVDHVTVRRCLVDSRLLIRDKAGSMYRLAVSRLSASIEDAAKGLDPAKVIAEVRLERENRKRARAVQLGR
jgi:hypothetical protein